jgi:hypothetical protein
MTARRIRSWLWWWATGLAVVVGLRWLFGPPPSFWVGLLGACAVAWVVGVFVGLVGAASRDEP